MHYLVHFNKRREANDFSKDFSCNFCNNYQSAVIEVFTAEHDFLICKTCLDKLIRVLDSKTLEKLIPKAKREIVEGKSDNKSTGLLSYLRKYIKR